MLPQYNYSNLLIKTVTERGYSPANCFIRKKDTESVDIKSAVMKVEQIVNHERYDFIWINYPTKIKMFSREKIKLETNL